MASFQGSARAATAVNPLVAKSESQKIINRGNYVLQEMEAVQQAHLKNAMNWLDGRRRADIQEAQNLKSNFDLETKTMDITHRAKQANYKTKAQNAKTQGENQARMWESLATISKSAGGIADTLHAKHKKDEMERGYNDWMMGNVGIEGQVGGMIAADKAQQGAYATEISAEVTAVQGKPSQVAGLLSTNSSYYAQGARMASAGYNSRMFGFYATEQLTTNTELFSTTDDDGNAIRIPINEAKGATQSADALRALTGIWMKSHGYTGMSGAALQRAGVWDNINSASSSLLTGIQKKAIEDMNADTEKTAAVTFVQTGTLDAYNNMSNLYVSRFGQVEGNEKALKVLMDPASNIPDAQIREILAMPSKGQPGVTIGQRQYKLVDQLWDERNTAVQKDFNQQQQAEYRQEEAKIDNARETLIPKLANGTLSADELDALQKDAAKNGETRLQSYYASLTKQTPEAEAQAYYNEMYREKANYGLLTAEEVLNNDNLTPKQQATFLGWVKEGASPELVEARKYGEGQVQTMIDERANNMGTEAKRSSSAKAAHRQAKYDYTNNFNQYLKGHPGDYNGANDYALGRLKDQMKDRSSGIYRTQDEKGMTTRGFPQFQVEATTFEDIHEDKEEWNINANLLRVDPEIVTRRKMIPQAELQKIEQQVKQGQKVTFPEVAKYYGEQSDMSTLEVIEGQFEAYDMETPKWVTEMKKEEAEIDPDIRRLMDYKPNPTSYNFSMGAVNSGDTKQFERGEGMRDGLQAVYRGGNIGPTSTGQHTDIKTTDGSWFSYDHLDNYVMVGDRELGMVPLSQVPETNTFEQHQARGSHGRDAGTYAGDKIYLQNGAKLVSSTPTAHGDMLRFTIPGDDRVFQFLHGRTL